MGSASKIICALLVITLNASAATTILRSLPMSQFVAAGGGATLSLESHGGSDFVDTSTSETTTNSLSWQAGDWIYVLGVTEDNGVSLNVPTYSGGTFAQRLVQNAPSDCRVYVWTNSPAGSGSGTIAAGLSVSGRAGIYALVYRNSTGPGAVAQSGGANALTISLTRGSANSHVIWAAGDWNAADDTTVTATPTGSVRVAARNSAAYTAFATSYGDQGAAGATSYGIADHGLTVDLARVAVEIKGP